MTHEDLVRIANEKLIHVTTRGRVTGRPHKVELWFAASHGKVYLSHEGEDTDWMRNIRRNSEVSFEIGGTTFTGRARILMSESENAWEGKIALYEKYYGKASKETVEDWFSLSKLILIDPLPAK